MTQSSSPISKCATVLTIVLVSAFAGVSLPEAKADDAYFRAGVQYYKKGDYKKAYGYFNAAGKNNPYDADNIYYQALTMQQLHNNKEAVRLYASLVSNFSYSNAGKLAASALNRLDPEYYQQLTKRGGDSARPSQVTSVTGRARSTSITGGGGGEGLSADFASLPSEARIPYTKEGNLLVIDASINNRGMKMIFDTGAEGCSFGKNHLRELNISEPQGKSTSLSYGVGSAGGVEKWSMPITLKVGTIERKNFEISVQENMTVKPLLGQSFFKDYQYTIDKTSDEAGTVHFVKKSAGGSSSRTASSSSSSRDPYAVPFQRHGRNLIVQVEVEGHPMTMFFDTGAASVAFTAEQLKKANITIPEDAQTATSTGIGGDTTSQLFPIKRIKMGPIEKTNFQVSCVGAANMPYPLLGQSFFGDWQYTIDNAASVIRFVRR